MALPEPETGEYPHLGRARLRVNPGPVWPPGGFAGSSLNPLVDSMK